MVQYLTFSMNIFVNTATLGWVNDWYFTKTFVSTLLHAFMVTLSLNEATSPEKKKKNNRIDVRDKDKFFA
jgi:hypothetical protein